ncbi:T9SS type A sorting domain-containing protein [Vicingus serpentipes]|uniref:T9SS type A sorting domain-containing protein n=1 Tax=Vicingus serpentipes TaxID=1926625 RepID=A0A5C6RUF1_9FLAO|nr:glycosyl hydrolase family 18 protein [Vicingus serpentipes]TXB65948.1 T9SS type A sorting domain-containing protein [Vicingus serpentipes]
MKKLLISIITLCCGVQLYGQAFNFNEPIVLGYFPSWSESWAATGQNSKLREVPALVNFVFLSFAKPDLTYLKGSYDISGTGIEVPYDGCSLKESVSALKDRGIHVILSIGGETFWNSSSVYNNINYQQIKDLVDDMGFVGIDWDFEPNGSFGNIGNTTNVQHFIDFFTNSRALMPKNEGYILACAPAGVGALGGQTNDDAASPYAYANRNSLTGETDANLYNGTVSTNGINLFGFSSTGHMIPVMQAVGDKIDLIAFQGYNTGASTNRSIMYDAYAYYAEIYGFKVAAGVHFPNEPWGPYYTYTHTNVASLSEHISAHPNRVGDNDGIMIWQVLLADASSSGYSYLNVASKVLNGVAESTAVADANDYSLVTYTGGSTGCTSGGGGGNTYCGVSEYDVSLSYPTAGTQVYANCKVWENQWWANPGESPGSNSVWLEVNDCSEGAGCTVGINEMETENEFTFFVAKNRLTFISNKEEVRNIKIYSLQGRLIEDLMVGKGNNTVMLSKINNTGVYILQFEGINQLITKKAFLE